MIPPFCTRQLRCILLSNSRSPVLVASSNAKRTFFTSRQTFLQSSLPSHSALHRSYIQDSNSKQRLDGEDISRLVPNTGLINLIDSKGDFRPNVSLVQTLGTIKPSQKLVVVRLEHPESNDDGVTDPTVHCKVISRNSKLSRDPKKGTPGSDQSKTFKKKKAPCSSLKTKSVTLGWSIAPNDLLVQKRASIHSWFEKGHPIQITLGKAVKRHQRTANTSLDLEKRKILLKTCRALCEEAGAIEQNTDGDINSNVLILNYLPPTTTTPQ